MELEKKLSTLYPGGNDVIAMRVVAFFGLLLAGLGALIDVRVGLVIAGLAAIVLALLGLVYVLTMNRVRRIDIFDNGMAVVAPRWTRQIFWDDVTGVQQNRVTTMYITPRYEIPMIVPAGFAIFFGVIRGGGDLRGKQKARYVFHTQNADPLAIGGDGRLFDLSKHVEEKIYPRVLPETVQQFEAGKAVPLTHGVSYSKDGITGTLLRKIKRTQHTIRVDLAWADISRMQRSDELFSITLQNKETVVFWLDEIINAPAFMTILSTLQEEGKLWIPQRS